jgi:GTPase
MIRKDKLRENIKITIDSEKDDGNKEYKLTLIEADNDRIERIASQMRYRVEEGRGEAFYTLGVTDEGGVIGLNKTEYEKSKKILEEACKLNDYSLSLISSQEIDVEKNMYEFLIREKGDNKYIDIKVACAGNVDSGKCLAKNTLIRMSNGELLPIQDIKKGDFVMGDDGKYREVLETSKGYGFMYRINNNFIINKNHILCFKAQDRNFIFFGTKRYCVSFFLMKNGLPKVFIIEPPKIDIDDDDLGKREAEDYLYNLKREKDCIQEGDIIEISLQDYVNLDKYTQTALKLYRVGIEYPMVHTKFDPYIYGYFLGNAKLENDEIIISEKNLRNHMNYFLSLSSISLKETNIPYRFKLNYAPNNEIINFLKKNLNSINNIYKYNSKQIRYELLAGIIDSYLLFEDDDSSYTLMLNKNNETLIYDIKELCLSLGFNILLKNCSRYEISDNKKTYSCVKIKIYGNGIENIIPLTIKTEKKSQSYNNTITLKTIENIGEGEYYGFQLDGNQRFLLEDFTVSHNSSLLGVLLTGNLDDSRGSARLNVFNYQHEIKSGRTSSISQHILGFDKEGKVINYGDTFGRKKSWTDIVRESSKIITFYDLCGHEKYLKTTIVGLTSQFPDLVLILVGANMGLSHMTKEHIFLCLSLHIPFLIVITKIDICKDRLDVMKNTVKDIKSLLKLPGINKIPYDVKKEEDILSVIKNIHSNTVIPIMYISNVSGEGLDYLRNFLNLYQKKIVKQENENKVEFHVDQTFIVTGVGLVIGGQLLIGKIRVGDKLILGPNNNNYATIQVKSLHVKRTSVDEADSGCYVCIAIRKSDDLHIRRGQVVIHSTDKPIQCWEFESEVTVLKSHSTTIKVGYEPCVHTLGIRQSARIIEIKNKQCGKNNSSNNEKNILRTGDRATVKFRFTYKPEFLKKNTRIILAEGRVKIIGKIIGFDEEIVSIV